MKARNKVAIYIDFSIRVPNFVASYDAFKAELFSDKEFGIDLEDTREGDEDPRMYWKSQIQNPDVENFYISKKSPGTDYELRSIELSSYFFNEEHFKKFIEDYSYNVYLDCEVPSKQDLTIINMAQRDLCEITLVDEYYSKRKITNTLFFLSKNPVYPQSIIFLGKGQELNENGYLAIWNPAKNADQSNGKGQKTFLNWFQELETKIKEAE